MYEFAEFAELLLLNDHACAEPRPQRLEVYEPVRMQWQWLTIFECCSHVFSDPSPVVEAPLWGPKSVHEVAA